MNISNNSSIFAFLVWKLKNCFELFHDMLIVKLRNIALFISIFTVFIGCRDSRENVLIRGEISNLETPVIIATHIHADSLIVDTIQSKNGKFSYKNTIDTFTVFTLYFNEYKTSAVVFADKKDKIELKGNAAFPDLIAVKGGEINEELSIFKENNKKLLLQRAELLQEIEETQSRHLENSFIGKNDQASKINALNHELTLNAESYIKENPTKIAGVILMNDFLKNSQNPEALNRALKYLQGNALKFPLTKSLERYNTKLQKTIEGAQFPAFETIDNKNDTVRSKDFNGKFLILSFLSTKGVESRENVQLLKKLYQHVSEKKVKFLSVYIDTDTFPITEVKDDSIYWTTICEKKGWSSDIVNAYNIEYVPYNILISPNGEILHRAIPAQDIEVAIDAEKENSKKEKL